MKIKGDITFLVNREYTAIEIIDREANTLFAKIELTPDELSAILSRQGNVHCDIEVEGLDRVGKKHENKYFEFIVPSSIVASSQYAEDLASYANTLLNDGWIADAYFGSQGSFFTKEGKKYARATIRRWI